MNVFDNLPDHFPPAARQIIAEAKATAEKRLADNEARKAEMLETIEARSGMIMRHSVAHSLETLTLMLNMVAVITKLSGGNVGLAHSMAANCQRVHGELTAHLVALGAALADGDDSQAVADRETPIIGNLIREQFTVVGDLEKLAADTGERVSAILNGDN
jgi:hypothetical protein